MRDEMKSGTGNPALEKSFSFALRTDCEELIRILGFAQFRNGTMQFSRTAEVPPLSLNVIRGCEKPEESFTLNNRVV